MYAVARFAVTIGSAGDERAYNLRTSGRKFALGRLMVAYLYADIEVTDLHQSMLCALNNGAAR